MSEQVSNAITFLFYYTEAKVGKTGLTVTVDVWKITQAGSASEIITGGSATEVGDGLYIYLLTSGNTADVGDYVAIGKTATTTVDLRNIPSFWPVGRGGIENLDGLISTRALDSTVMKAANYTAPPTAADNADAVWDEALAGHAGAGTAGAALSASGAAGDPWSTELPGSYTEGTAGYQIGETYDRMVTQVPGTGPVVSIPGPSDLSQTVAYAYCYDENGAPLEGVTVTIQIATTSMTGGGAAYSGAVVTATSNSDGLASVEIPRGTHITFRARRGNGRWMQFAGDDADTVQIPYIVGQPGETISVPGGD